MDRSPSFSDEALLARARGLRPPLIAFLTRRLSDPSLAEDLTQDLPLDTSAPLLPRAATPAVTRLQKKGWAVAAADAGTGEACTARLCAEPSGDADGMFDDQVSQMLGQFEEEGGIVHRCTTDIVGSVTQDKRGLLPLLG